MQLLYSKFMINIARASYNFCLFTHVTAHSPILPSLYLRHSSFANPSVASPTSQLILQPFRRFTYVTAHSPTLLSLYLRQSSFSNPSVASHTSQLILQTFFRFSYVTGSSPYEPSMLQRWIWTFESTKTKSPTQN